MDIEINACLIIQNGCLCSHGDVSGRVFRTGDMKLTECRYAVGIVFC